MIFSRIKKINKDSIVMSCDKTMEYALYILIFFLPISKAIIEICASFAISAFIIKKCIVRKKILPQAYINKYLYLYLFICGLSIVFSTNVAMSLRAFFSKLLENILIYFILVEVFNNKKKIYVILGILFLSGFLICADGIFQFFTHIDFLRQRPWPYGAEPFTMHIKGPFATANDFAAFLAPLSILSLALFFARIKKTPTKYFLRTFLLVSMVCLFLSLSRGAWIGIFVGFGFIGLFVDRKIFFRLVLISLVVFLLIWQFLPQEKRSHINRFNIRDPGGRDRRILNNISWDMFSSNPMLGLGLGTYMYNFDRFNYDKKAYPWGASYAHNCYLQMAAEIGLLGLLSFLLLIIVLFLKSIQELNKLEINIGRNLSIGLLAAICTYLIHSIFDTNLYNLDIGMLFWYLLGLTQSQLKLLDKADTDQKG